MKIDITYYCHTTNNRIPYRFCTKIASKKEKKIKRRLARIFYLKRSFFSILEGALIINPLVNLQTKILDMESMSAEPPCPITIFCRRFIQKTIKNFLFVSKILTEIQFALLLY